MTPLPGQLRLKAHGGQRNPGISLHRITVFLLFTAEETFQMGVQFPSPPCPKISVRPLKTFFENRRIAGNYTVEQFQTLHRRSEA